MNTDLTRIIKQNTNDSASNPASRILMDSMNDIEMSLMNRQEVEESHIKESDSIILIKTLDNKILTVNLLEFMDKNVRALKQHLFPSELNNNQTVRLIYKGKLLGDDDKISDISYEKGFFIHAVISSNPALPSPSQLNLVGDNPGGASVIHIHPEARPEFQNRRGFDNYLDQYTEKDIERLREIWHTGYKLDNYSGYRSQMYLKEEQLMATKQREIDVNLKQIKADFEREEEGTYQDLVISFILGYAFNFFSMLISIVFPFNRKIKFGATLGFFLYIGLFLLFKNSVDGR